MFCWHSRQRVSTVILSVLRVCALLFNFYFPKNLYALHNFGNFKTCRRTVKYKEGNRGRRRRR